MYSAATVKRARTIVRNAEQQRTATKKVLATRTQQNAPTVKADWRNRPASKAQLSRINALEASLGYRKSTMRTIGTAGQASDLYKSLKAEA